jgi:hypothetical protein
LRNQVCDTNLLLMTTQAAQPGDDPRRLLSSARELALRVRREQRATWFPLLVFAAVTFAAIPVLRYSGRHLGPCTATGPGERICVAYSSAVFIYWPAALVLAYAAIVAFYVRRSRARGIETRVRPYAVAGIIIAAAVTGTAFWAAHTPPSASDAALTGLAGLSHRLATPAAAIGLALLVLAWTERNRALLLLTAAYLAIVLAPSAFGWAVPAPWLQVTEGSVLLLGGIGFALAQRPLRSPAA